MNEYGLIASRCINDLGPKCPSPEVRSRMRGESFDHTVASVAKLNAICESCSDFEPNKE